VDLLAFYLELKLEDIVVGDNILSYNFDTKNLEKDTVLEIHNPEVDKIIIYNDKLSTTRDHPIYTTNKGWASFDPSTTLRNYDLEVAKLESGDIILDNLKEQQLTNILVKNSLNTTTYNLSHIKNNSNFIANDILVHNKRRINDARQF
jgi:intein/homing endonuclease